MTKTDIAEKIAMELDIYKIEAKQILDILLDNMVDALKNGDKIEIRGLGSFHVKNRKTMKRRHPSTKKIITIPGQKVIKFTPGKFLKNIDL
ncbi:MAG TPA: integration host factor subunit beta [Firmicutes bacterium]|nr:integration host factor subunit beta [Bacillota bacterium]